MGAGERARPAPGAAAGKRNAKPNRRRAVAVARGSSPARRPRAAAAAPPSPRAQRTRARILQAAYEEFSLHGFQGGSLNAVVAKSGVTKGALFHHFRGKAMLGYAVVEEVIAPSGKARWIDPVLRAADPIAAIQRTFRRNIREMAADPAALARGCPLNTLAQEMSALDEGFRQRIERAYQSWRDALTSALERARERGQIRKAVAPAEVAALIVAGQMGIWGTAKNSQTPAVIIAAGEALCHLLDALASSPTV